MQVRLSVVFNIYLGLFGEESKTYVCRLEIIITVAMSQLWSHDMKKDETTIHSLLSSVSHDISFVLNCTFHAVGHTFTALNVIQNYSASRMFDGDWDNWHTEWNKSLVSSSNTIVFWWINWVEMLIEEKTMMPECCLCGQLTHSESLYRVIKILIHKYSAQACNYNKHILVYLGIFNM